MIQPNTILYPYKPSTSDLRSLSFSQVGDINYEITFQLLKYLKHEKQFVPWLADFHCLLPINNLLKRTPKYAVFQVSIKGIFYLIINFKRLGLLAMSYSFIRE